MAVAWNEDPAGSETRIAANIRAVGAQIYTEAPRREPPSLATAQDWHRAIYEGVPLPVPYYAGEVRDSDPRFPDLIDYEVQIGHLRGVPAAQVPAELELLQTRARNAIAGPDRAMPVGQPPATPLELRSVLLLAANLHGEWVRIHPFANGNGRIARLWVLWVAARYGLPPFIRLKPRPAGLSYAAAALASMSGQHTLMAAVLGQMLGDYLTHPPSSKDS
ncbi:MAG: Fic family protein [Solirubrobacterales bacterium]